MSLKRFDRAVVYVDDDSILQEALSILQSRQDEIDQIMREQKRQNRYTVTKYQRTSMARTRLEIYLKYHKSNVSVPA